MNLSDIKKSFPIYNANPDLVYLDSSASALKPQTVIDSISEYYSTYSSNIHRGLYPISLRASEKYEEARMIVAKFINAEPEEIIFTSGTTDSLNFVAESLLRSNLISSDDSILLTEIEHHANILPWQRISTSLKYLPYKVNTGVDASSTKATKMISEAKLVSYSLVSNVTGGITRIKRSNDSQIIVVDAAQAVSHMKVDVKELDCDFLAFSGHKLFGPTGIGVLYINKKFHGELEPYKVGGGMIREVLRESASWDHSPAKYEAGTPAIAEAIGLAAAVEFISGLDFQQLQSEVNKLKGLLISELNKFEGIQIFNDADSMGVVSFAIDGIHPHDIADYIGSKNICIRAGHHCTNILHREIFCLPATCRISLSIYNSEADVQKLIGELKSALEIFKKS